MTDKTLNFIEKVRQAKGADYEVLGQYKTMKTKIKLRHRVCGYVWDTSPDNFIRTKSGCPKCAGNARPTSTEFIKEVISVTGGRYEVLEPYLNAKTQILMRHLACGYRFKVTPESFLRGGSRCPRCAGKMKRSDAEFKDLVREKVSDEYSFEEPYVNNQTKIMCRHNVCNYSWKVSPANFLRLNSRCPRCAGNAPLTHNQFKKRVLDEVGSDYTIIGVYKNFTTPITCKHSCGHIWEVSPNNLLRGRRCPRCQRESRGEKFVRLLLENTGLTFDTQVSFEGCLHKNLLRFDFYIPALNLAIEYDGEQHFKPINFGGRGIAAAKRRFDLIRKRDSIKDKYCREYGVRLLRIPYYLTEEETKELLVHTINSQEVTQKDSRRKVSS